MSSVPWGPPTVLSLCKAVREGGGDEIRGLCGCLYPTQSTTRRKCQEFSLMATCHNVLSNLHTAPAGLQTRDMGSAVPLPRLCLRPYKSLLGHTQSKPLSPIPTSGIALFEFSQGARPDLAPDSWRSGTQTRARQSGKRRGASSPEPQFHQRSRRTRLPEGGTTHRAGWNPGAARVGRVQPRIGAPRPPAPKPPVGQPPTPGHTEAQRGQDVAAPQEHVAHLCFMLLYPRGRRGHPAARRDTQPQPPRASPQRPARRQQQ